MTPAQILRMNFHRHPLSALDGEFVSDFEAARARHILGQEQPTRETPPEPVAEPEMEWPEEPAAPVLVPTLEVEFD